LTTRGWPASNLKRRPANQRPPQKYTTQSYQKSARNHTLITMTIRIRVLPTPHPEPPVPRTLPAKSRPTNQDNAQKDTGHSESPRISLQSHILVILQCGPYCILIDRQFAAQATISLELPCRPKESSLSYRCINGNLSGDASILPSRIGDFFARGLNPNCQHISQAYSST
jgi:hypothetical protein